MRLDPNTLETNPTFSAWIDFIGTNYGVDPYLLRAIIQCESGWDPNAVNAQSGASGLMQIMPATWNWIAGQIADVLDSTPEKIGMTNILDPQKNVEAAAYLLCYLTSKYGEPWKALDCYAMGEGNAKRMWKESEAPSSYTARFMALAEKLRTESANPAECTAPSFRMPEYTKDVAE